MAYSAGKARGTGTTTDLVIGWCVAAASALPALAVSFPFSRAITIRQAQAEVLPAAARYDGLWSVLRRVGREGGGGLGPYYRGAGTALLITTTRAPLTFLLRLVVDNGVTPSPNMPLSLLSSTATGAAVGAGTALVLQPLQFAQTRLMLDMGGGAHGPRLFHNGLGVCRQVVAEAGPRALWTGGLGTVAAMALHRGVSVGLYGGFNGLYSGAGTDGGLAASTLLFRFGLGYTASVVAAAAAYPIETAVARYQVTVPPAPAASAHHRGVLSCIRTVVAHEGVAALWRGFSIKFGTGVAGALGLIGYDMVKANLRGNGS
jgi:hypothetical protein